VNVKLWKAVDKRFLASDIKGAIQVLEDLLANEKVDRFKGAISSYFSNSPLSLLSKINKFIRTCDKSFDVQAVYLEMNGFDINYNRWYFDSFGYKKCGDLRGDLDWLSDWQSDDWTQITLKGMEKIQKDFQWYHEQEIWEDKKYKRAYELLVLLVMAKFVLLIQSALEAGDLVKPIPVLATAHDFDIVGRFAP
jgi:hypothetical protein